MDSTCTTSILSTAIIQIYTQSEIPDSVIYTIYFDLSHTKLIVCFKLKIALGQEFRTFILLYGYPFSP